MAYIVRLEKLPMNLIAYSYMPFWVFVIFPLLVISTLSSTVGSAISLIYYWRHKKSSTYTRLTFASATIGFLIVLGLMIANGFSDESRHPVFLLVSALLLFNLASAWVTSRKDHQPKLDQKTIP